MESFAHILTAGGKTNSLGRAHEVIEAVTHDPSRLDELYACISADDPWVRMRAIDSFEKLCRISPDWAQPYLAAMLGELTASTQPSIQWHLAQIFAETNLSPTQAAKAVAWLRSLLATTEVDWIVAVNAMKALLKFKHDGLISSDELLALFTIQAGHKSASVRKKAKGFMEKL